MIVVNRFRAGSDFGVRLGAAARFLGARAGCLDVEVARNLDEADLWVLVSRWADVGSYRRALSGFEAKMELVPLLSQAIDEPSAYDSEELVGENRPRGG